MRLFSTASLLVVGFAGTVLAHRHKTESPVRRRKSLGFGPEHPHAVFHSSPYQVKTNGFKPLDPNTSPHEVAELFLFDMLGERLSARYGYKIREDSYTDSNTGVTHVYVRQLINGYEVADGDMNINIKDGMVLSYGSSFFDGTIPELLNIYDNSEELSHPHREYCEILAQELDLHVQRSSALQSEQVVLERHRESTRIDELQYIHWANCRFANVPYEHVIRYLDDSFKAGLLHFMVAVTPKDHIAEDILKNFDKYLFKMTYTNEFAPSTGTTQVTVNNVPDAVSPVKVKVAYVQVPNKKGDAMHLNLVWKFEVEMEDNWYEAAISATPPHRIVSVIDWASDAPLPPQAPSSEPATYNVFAWGTNDPSVGHRSLQKESFDALASPVGWHALPYTHDPSMRGVRWKKEKDFYRNTTTTWGNNVFAQENWEGLNNFINNYRPDAGNDKAFDYKYNPKSTSRSDALDEAKKYINNTVTQLFYTTNLVHDLYYRYGFDEVSGNFQQYNFERGGAENDAVIANAQDGSGYNNANFMTPPDGQNGRMRMYLWNTDLPFRDGDLEAGIVIHELSHGLSTRLTGGPANSGCLGWGESGGMGEGWGDFLATTVRSNKIYSDYPMGAWAANREQGIRNFIYSLNETINPSTYKTLDKPGYWGVHAIGEVWAEMLWVVSQGLIKKHGYTEDLFPPAPEVDGTVPAGDFYRPRDDTKKPLVPKHGNSLMVQLVINAMKLQPCRPSFFDARDAIIQADQILTNGENFCLLWEGFASRGLGVDAKVDGRTPWGGGIRTNDFKVPVACRNEPEPEPEDPQEPEDPELYY